MIDRATRAGRGLTRRSVFAGLASVVLSGSASAGKAHPSIAFMQKVAKDMLNAHRQGTVASFKTAIQRHADVPDIANYSLGRYKSQLPASQKRSYYNGVATFMARYFADQSREYKVAKYEIGEASVDGDDILVDSKVYLMSGQTYTVVWRIAWRGGRYRVMDAKVLGFSLVYLQRGIFTAYISKKKGNVGELVAALNR